MQFAARDAAPCPDPLTEHMSRRPVDSQTLPFIQSTVTLQRLKLLEDNGSQNGGEEPQDFKEPDSARRVRLHWHGHQAGGHAIGEGARLSDCCDFVFATRPESFLFFAKN
jgi:hypothetical protein